MQLVSQQNHGEKQGKNGNIPSIFMLIYYVRWQKRINVTEPGHIFSIPLDTAR